MRSASFTKKSDGNCTLRRAAMSGRRRSTDPRESDVCNVYTACRASFYKRRLLLPAKRSAKTAGMKPRSKNGLSFLNFPRGNIISQKLQQINCFSEFF
jgi:hypothetical protein